jgi:hypothetical protein
MRTLIAGILVAFCACSTASRATAPPDAARALVGTWRLVSYEDWTPSGERRTPYGENPIGYFVYDTTGRVFINFMKGPALSAEGFVRGVPATLERKGVAFDAYVSYFGTYTVDPVRQVVVHHVEGSLNPSYTGTDQPRPFQLVGDTLTIGDRKTWKRVLTRVPVPSS